MPQFNVSYLDRSGHLLSKRINAQSAQHAQHMCAALGLTVLSVRRVFQFKLRARPAFSSALMAQELLSLHKAGLSIPESLQALLSKANEAQAEVLQGLLQRLREGKGLAQALADYPNEFPDLLRAMVEAAERTSNLDQALERYVEYANQADAIKRKLSNAALYPCLLIVVGGGVLLFLMMYVIPRFAGVYEGMQGDLPWLSELLLWWGRHMRDHAAWVFGSLVSAAWGAYLLFKQPAVHMALVALLLRNKAVARVWTAYGLSRLYRALGLLVGGGIPVRSALGHVSQLVRTSQRAPLQQVCIQLERGIPLSAAFAEAGLTTEISAQLLAVGERTGALGDMLTQAAVFLESETAKAVEAFSRLFEPLLMALIGVVIGGVIVLMYMPIFELANSLQ